MNISKAVAYARSSTSDHGPDSVRGLLNRLDSSVAVLESNLANLQAALQPISTPIPTTAEKEPNETLRSDSVMDTIRVLTYKVDRLAGRVNIMREELAL